MGPMLMTGLMTFAAAIALGLVASATRAPTSSDTDLGSASTVASAKAVRGAAIVFMAFCVGLGVLGTVVGLLALFLVPISDAGAAPFAAVPAIVGVAGGLLIIGRRRREVDRPSATYAIVNILALGSLGIVVGMLVILITADPPGHTNDLAFAALGIIGGSAVLAVGVRSGQAIESMQGADEATVKALVNTHLTRVLIFEVAGVAAVAASLLIVTASS